VQYTFYKVINEPTTLKRLEHCSFSRVELIHVCKRRADTGREYLHKHWLCDGSMDVSSASLPSISVHIRMYATYAKGIKLPIHP